MEGGVRKESKTVVKCKEQVARVGVMKTGFSQFTLNLLYLRRMI